MRRYHSPMKATKAEPVAPQNHSTCAGQGSTNSPRPNLTQMRISVTMHASSSHTKTPTLAEVLRGALMYSYHSRVAGVAMENQMTRRMVLIGLVGGIQSRYFRKKARTLHVRFMTQSARHCSSRVGPDIIAHFMSSKLCGVNCPRPRLNFPASVFCCPKLVQWYSLLFRYLTIFMPRKIPMLLQMRTSRIQESHQHSLKLGSQCWKVSSISSNITDTKKSMP
mmetsp:Transcript_41008/g.103918  ORF Transcript_41008/g.103918 Transcript_41008/m.103918 type:complete len:222 (+) Transcript_41008:267-932(+)